MTALGSCPGCGSSITFRTGASVCAICEYCNTTVRRTDRGLENLGVVANLVDAPGIVAVGDSCVARGIRFWVLGSVTLAHDMGGEWTEWYVSFENGQWGWLAYAQGMFMLTQKVQPTKLVPPPSQIRLDTTVDLQPHGHFRVVECKKARIASMKGELPFAPKAGDIRYYADLHGPSGGFGTIDWGNRTEPVEVFVGYQFTESHLQISEQSERPHKQIRLEGLMCPSCGASIDLRGGKSIEHVACQYCRTIFDSESRRIVAKQIRTAQVPDIAIGSFGTVEGQQYTVIGFQTKSVRDKDEVFYWNEYLLYAQGVGFRWLVSSSGRWHFVTPVNAADVDINKYPRLLAYNHRLFWYKEQSTARTMLVLGEFYWRVTVGEITHCMDFSNGADLVSREEGSSEVHYSYAASLPQGTVAKAFNIREKVVLLPDAEDPPDWKDRTDWTSFKVFKYVFWGLATVFGIWAQVAMDGGCGCDDDASSPSVRGTPTLGGGWSSGK